MEREEEVVNSFCLDSRIGCGCHIWIVSGVCLEREEAEWDRNDLHETSR